MCLKVLVKIRMRGVTITFGITHLFELELVLCGAQMYRIYTVAVYGYTLTSIYRVVNK